MRLIVQLSRYIVGLWLLVSGLLMLNDLNAFTNKLDVYFEVLHLGALQSIALYWGVFLGVLHMLLGFALLLGSFVQIVAWLTAAFALLSTCFTAYVSINHAVVEMPSFGELLHWSPLMAFYRDIFVVVLSVFILLGKNQIETLGGYKWNVFFFILSLFAVAAFPYFTLTHGAFYSALPLKKGMDMRNKWALPVAAPRDSFVTFFYYYNLKQQRLDSFKADNIGEHMKELANKKKFRFEKTSTRCVRKGAVPVEAGFILLDAYQRPVQDSLLNSPGMSLWIVFRRPADLDETTLRKIKLLLASASETKMPIVGISKLPSAASDVLRHDNNWAMSFVQCTNAEFLRQLTPNAITCILVHNGKVEQLWLGKNIPTDLSRL